MWVSRGRVAKTRSVRRVRIVHRQITLAHLPKSLDGLRIVRISDFHLGVLHRVTRLPRIVELCHALSGHLIAVTGDVVDLSLDVLGDAAALLGRLEAPLGVYFVPGNHDYLEDASGFVTQMRAAGPGRRSVAAGR